VEIPAILKQMVGMSRDVVFESNTFPSRHNQYTLSETTQFHKHRFKAFQTFEQLPDNKFFE